MEIDRHEILTGIENKFTISSAGAERAVEKIATAMMQTSAALDISA